MAVKGKEVINIMLRNTKDQINVWSKSAEVNKVYSEVTDS